MLKGILNVGNIPILDIYVSVKKQYLSFQLNINFKFKKIISMFFRNVQIMISYS